MTYRDDFYTKDNIIGYTGDLKEPQKFTVYFADAGGINPSVRKDADGKDRVSVEFGHITQDHEVKDNIGREKVYSSTTYAIYNTTIDGEEHAQEAVFGVLSHDFKDFHTSRNKFEPVTKGNTEVLAKAIERCPSIKSRYGGPGFI
jgi:hypothetical protein